MTHTEDGYFSYGIVTSPLDATSSNTNLKVIDPIRYSILRFATWIIQHHIGALWNKTVTELGLTELINYPVKQAISYYPIPIAPESDLQFPLLCVYKVRESYENKTFTHSDVETEIHISYILPPLSGKQREMLEPFLGWIVKAIQDRVRQGVDSNYNNGELVWSNTGVDNIGCEGSEYGNFWNETLGNVKTNLPFPMVTLRLILHERDMPASNALNFVPLTNIDGYVSTMENPTDDPETDAIDLSDFIANFNS